MTDETEPAPATTGAPPDPRDCKHGRLARSCWECEAEEEIAALKAEVARLRADARIDAHRVLVETVARERARADAAERERDATRFKWEGTVRALAENIQRRKDAEAEAERVREALKDMIAEFDYFGTRIAPEVFQEPESRIRRRNVIERARRALSDEGAGGGQP